MHHRIVALDCLIHYKERKRALAAIDYTLKECHGADYDCTIEALAFERKTGERVQDSVSSDKTGNIVLCYRGIAEEDARVARSRLESQHRQLSQEIHWLDYCLEHLDAPFPALLRGLYIDNRTRDAVCDELCISQSTLTRYSKRALEELSTMYDIRFGLDMEDHYQVVDIS